LSRASELNIKDDECDISGMDVARVERAGDEENGGSNVIKMYIYHEKFLIIDFVHEWLFLRPKSKRWRNADLPILLTLGSSGEPQGLAEPGSFFPLGTPNIHLCWFQANKRL
jgi:hypothetical protein